MIHCIICIFKSDNKRYVFVFSFFVFLNAVLQIHKIPNQVWVWPSTQRLLMEMVLDEDLTEFQVCQVSRSSLDNERSGTSAGGKLPSPPETPPSSRRPRPHCTWSPPQAWLSARLLHPLGRRTPGRSRRSSWSASRSGCLQSNIQATRPAHTPRRFGSARVGPGLGHAKIHQPWGKCDLMVGFEVYHSDDISHAVAHFQLVGDISWMNRMSSCTLRESHAFV